MVNASDLLVDVADLLAKSDAAWASGDHPGYYRIREDAVRALDEALAAAREEGAEETDEDDGDREPAGIDDEWGYNPYAGGYDPDC